MGGDRHIILEPYGHIRFLLKSIFAFGVLLGAVALLADFDPWVAAAKDFLLNHEGYTFLLFVGFLTGHILLEANLHHKRQDLEKRRSSPAPLDPRAEIKRRRRQAVSNRRRRR